MKLNNPELLRSRCLINGEWCDALSGKREAVINPATGAELASIPLVSEEETQQAIAAAQRAQNEWKQLTAKQRSALLLAWADKVLAAQEDLAQLMTAEQGKSLAEARGEVAYAASFITWFAEEAKRVDGAVLQAPQASQRLVVVKQPIGVCAAITPWNFPAAMITRKVAPALAAGCAIIVKPAEQTPLTALALAKLAQDAGIPAGVLQVVTGEAAQVGKVLCDSPVVRKLSFTGSTEVGRILMAQCAPSIRNCRWSWAVTRRSSCSTTPIWTRRWRASWPPSSATAARPACALTASTCRTAFTSGWRKSWWRRSSS